MGGKEVSKEGGKVDEEAARGGVMLRGEGRREQLIMGSEKRKGGGKGKRNEGEGDAGKGKKRRGRDALRKGMLM